MRIRTIKPEFWQSEKMSLASREARLLFVGLWSMADDSGRARAASRLLASTLFPYDEDAHSLISGWLRELEQIGCVRLYEVDGCHYLEIPKWLDHQKIDKPSKSKLPAFDDSSRKIDDSSRKIALDQGSGIRDQGEDQGEGARTREGTAAMNASLDGMESSASAPEPTRVVRELRTFGDLQAMNPKIHVGKGERDAWEAVLRIYGWAITQEAITEQVKAIRQPGHRVLLSNVQRYLDANYERNES